MLQSPNRPSVEPVLPYTTADMSARLAKRKAEQEATRLRDAAYQAISNSAPFKQDKPWYEDLYNLLPTSNPISTPINMGGGQVSMGGQGTGKSLVTEPARLAVRRAVGDITAIPNLGKDSPSYTASQIRREGVVPGVLKAAIDYSQFIPVATKGAGLVGDVSNAYKLAMMERQANPFPALRGATNVIDVVPGGRVPARIAPTSPTTRLVEAQTARALPTLIQRALPPAKIAPAIVETPASRLALPAFRERPVSALATTADMAEQLARAQARQQTHFGTVSKQPIETMRSNEFPHIENARSGRKQTYSFPVYEINGKKVAFGNTEMDNFSPGFNAQDVEVVPVNPYKITGLDKTSIEGQNLARLFFDANQGFAIENGSDQYIGQVSALTYAASRGDNVAMQELQRLANVGNEFLTAKNVKESNDFLATKQWNEPGYWNNKSGALVTVGREADGYRRVQRPLEIDDMFLVHQTDYKPQVDANGNIILKPTGDYLPMDPTTGKQMVDSKTGKALSNPDRDNIHFSMNHLVKGHMSRPSPVGGSYVIVVPLRDVLNANPGSLDNLYSIDTYLTPKPGQGLTIPMQSGRVINAPSDQLENLVNGALDEVGKLHNQRPDYETLKIDGGTHYAHTPDIDDRITQNAIQMIPQEYPEYVGGVRTGPHTSSIHWWLQQFENSLNPANGKKYLSQYEYSDLSPNAKLRAFDSNTDKFTTGTLDTTEQMLEGL